MKKITLLFSMLFVLALSSQLKAQDYQSAIGLRLGYPFGVTFKHFFNESAAIDLFVGTRYSGLTFGANYEIHKSLPDVAGLRWYWGPGAIFTFYDYGGVGSSNFGIDGVLGLDYTFADAPFNLSLDFMPTFLFGEDYYGGFEIFGGVSARYIFK
jgi:hypothetical protein